MKNRIIIPEGGKEGNESVDYRRFNDVKKTTAIIEVDGHFTFIYKTIDGENSYRTTKCKFAFTPEGLLLGRIGDYYRYIQQKREYEEKGRNIYEITYHPDTEDLLTKIPQLKQKSVCIPPVNEQKNVLTFTAPLPKTPSVQKRKLKKQKTDKATKKLNSNPEQQTANEQKNISTAPVSITQASSSTSTIYQYLSSPNGRWDSLSDGALKDLNEANEKSKLVLDDVKNFVQDPASKVTLGNFEFLNECMKSADNVQQLILTNLNRLNIPFDSSSVMNFSEGTSELDLPPEEQPMHSVDEDEFMKGFLNNSP